MQNDSRVDKTPGSWECDGCDGSRRIRTVLIAARMAMSRRGSFRVVLLTEGGNESNGDWKILSAVLRSPVACAIMPAVYSIRLQIVSGRLSPSSSETCRSSFRFCLAKSQSLLAHARNICWRSTLQYNTLRHSIRLFALTIDSAISSGALKLPGRIVRDINH